MIGLKDIFSSLVNLANGNGNGNTLPIEETVPVCHGEAENVQFYEGSEMVLMPGSEPKLSDIVKQSSPFEQRLFYFGMECAFPDSQIIGYIPKRLYIKFVKVFTERSNKEAESYPSVGYELLEEGDKKLILDEGKITKVYPIVEKGPEILVAKKPKVKEPKRTKTKAGRAKSEAAIAQPITQQQPPPAPPAVQQIEPHEPKKPSLADLAQSIIVDNEGAKKLLDAMTKVQSPDKARKIFEQWGSLDEKSVLKRNLKNSIINGNDAGAKNVLNIIDNLPEKDARDVLRSVLYDYSQIASSDVRRIVAEKLGRHGNADDIIAIIDKTLDEKDESVNIAQIAAIENLADKLKTDSAGLGFYLQLTNRKDKMIKKAIDFTKAKNSELRVAGYVLIGIARAMDEKGLDKVIAEGVKSHDPDSRVGAYIAQNMPKLDLPGDSQKPLDVYAKYFRYTYRQKEYKEWQAKASKQEGAIGKNIESADIVDQRSFYHLHMRSELNYNMNWRDKEDIYREGVVDSGAVLQELRIKDADALRALTSNYDDLNEDEKIKTLKAMKALNVYTWDFLEKLVDEWPNVAPRLQVAYMDFIKFFGAVVHHSTAFIKRRQQLKDMYGKSQDLAFKRQLGTLLFASGEMDYISDYLYNVGSAKSIRDIKYYYVIARSLPDSLLSAVLNATETVSDPIVQKGLLRTLWSKWDSASGPDVTALKTILNSNNVTAVRDLVDRFLASFISAGADLSTVNDIRGAGYETFNPALLNLADHPDPEISMKAAMYCANLCPDPKLIPHLRRAIKHPDGHIRSHAVTFYTGLILKYHKKTSEVYKTAVNDILNMWESEKDEGVVRSLMSAIAKLGINSDGTLDAIYAIAKTDGHGLQWSSLKTLSRYLDKPNVHELFVKYLGHSDREIRWLVAEKLFSYEKNVQAAKTIISLITSEEYDHRDVAKTNELNWWVSKLIAEDNHQIRDELAKHINALVKLSVRNIQHVTNSYHADYKKRVTEKSEAILKFASKHTPDAITDIINYLQQAAPAAESDYGKQWIKNWEENLKAIQAGAPINRHTPEGSSMS